MDFKLIVRYITFIKNFSWLIFEKIIRIGDAFLVGIWIARYLGPTNFGIISFSESFIFLFAALAGLGLDQVVVRELTGDRYNKNLILGSTFVLKLLGFLLMEFSILFTIYFLNLNQEIKVFICLISISVLFKCFGGIDFYFQSITRSKPIVISNAIALIAASMVRIYLIIAESSLVYFALAYIIEAFLATIGYLISYKLNNLSITNWKVKYHMLILLIKDSWVLVIGALSAALYFRIDQVMIGELIGLEEVGIFSVAVKVSTVFLMITVAVTQSIFPMMVRLRKKSRVQFIKKLQIIYNILVKIAITISIIITIYADFIVSYLFGELYQNSSEILIIYIWSLVFVYLSNLSWCYYLNENLAAVASARLLIGALVNIILNVIFIEQFGLKGAAYSTLISHVISGYLINLMFIKTRENFMLQSIAILNIFNIKSWLRPI